jgi:hypothetical protein
MMMNILVLARRCAADKVDVVIEIQKVAVASARTVALENKTTKTLQRSREH